MMNGAMYERLGPELQQKTQIAAQAALQYMIEQSDKETEADLKKMEAEGANVVRSFDARPWQEKIRGATAAMEGKGLWRKGLYDEIQKIQ